MEYDGMTWNGPNKYGYYTKYMDGKRWRLHRYIYEKEQTKLIKGMDIHHLDYNKENNNISNLIQISKSLHTWIHANDMSDETKKKIGDKSRNNKYNLGKKFTEERKQKLKGKKPWNKGMKGYNSGKNHHRFGKNVSDEMKNKISNTLKNNSCRSKTYKIIHPNGKIETIKGLKKYCESMDWPYKYVYGKMKQGVDFRGYHINEQIE